ncbi:hypothetical protein [Sphingosinithalassobacter portus]|uniref:hypothetical protein n=1 Tax=Stakelama portus TaxID=2676234 RepID=UPI000D6E2BDD|nr:hypothetical protein [Sphingosinithalassobacter portus]
MTFGKKLALAAAAAMVVAAPVAQAVDAGSLSLSRASTSAKSKKNDFAGSVIIPIIVGGIVVGYTIYQVTTDDNETDLAPEPVSP